MAMNPHGPASGPVSSGGTETDPTEGGGAYIGPYNSFGGNHGVGTTNNTPGSSGMGVPWRPYTSSGDQVHLNDDHGGGVGSGSDAGPGAGPDLGMLEAPGGYTTNYAHDLSNANSVKGSTSTGRPNSLGAVPAIENVDAPNSVTQPQYQSGWDHNLSDPQAPYFSKGVDPNVPALGEVINHSYNDNGSSLEKPTRNPAHVRQSLGRRTNGNSGKQPPTPGV